MGEFFSSKVPEFLHVLFNLVKHSRVFFLAVLHFVSEKNVGKISRGANECNKVEQEKTIL